jgi:hypothetical protein
MKLPIDTAGLTFMCASEPEPVLDFETKNPKADENGEPLYGLQVVVLSDGGAEVINLKVPGRPTVKAGQMLNLRSLVATPWSMGDRSGVAFRAAEVEPQAKAEKAGSANRA